MRRSLLFIPGNNPSMLRNADIFLADGIILDLEDAVSVSEKDAARDLVKSFLLSIKNYSSEIIIRINGFDTPFYLNDLEAVVSDKIDTIMLPKATIESTKALINELSKIEKKKNLKKKIAIIPIIELAISLIQVDEIAALDRVNGILLGAEDLTSDLEVKRTKEGTEIFYARSRVVVSCKAYQIDAIDTPFTDVNNDAGLLRDASFSKSLGMNAKSAIHPNQINIINEVYSPSEDEINWAKKVLLATEEAKKKNLGVFSLDGKMVDKPIISRAEKIIKKAIKFKLIEE